MGLKCAGTSFGLNILPAVSVQDSDTSILTHTRSVYFKSLGM